MIDLAGVLALHTAATWGMVGLIWFVQVVHYPLMAAVGEPGFARYEAAHVRWTTYVVAPLMLTEVATAAALVTLYLPQDAMAWTGFGLLFVVWLSTALWQVPCHRLLERGFNEVAHRRLVRTNWVRTVAWTARGAIALLMLPIAP